MVSTIKQLNINDCKINIKVRIWEFTLKRFRGRWEKKGRRREKKGQGIGKVFLQKHDRNTSKP